MSTTSGVSASNVQANSATTPTVKSGANALGGLDATQFLQLFCQELQDQDPTNPTDTKDMLNQFAQLTQLQSTTEMQTSLGSLNTTMANLGTSSQFTQAASLLGTSVQYLDADGNTQTGNVDAVQIGSGGVPSLMIGGNAVSLSALSQVTKG